MQTTIKLQEPFMYSKTLLMITICIVLGITCYLIYFNKKKKVEEKEDVVKAIPNKNIKNIPVIKSKYIEQLESIEYKYKNEMIELRKAYQLISESIRMFIFEVTDITTQNYSLIEIKRLNIPKLYELIEEYYEPEFASKPSGDFEIAIKKARRIVKEWN